MECERCKAEIVPYEDEGHWYREVYDVWLFPTVFRYGEQEPKTEEDDDSSDTKTFDGPYYSLCADCWGYLRGIVRDFVNGKTVEVR